MKNLIKYCFIAFIMFSFMSCSQKVHDYDWKWGTERCKNKGGLRYVKSFGKYISCKCHNGDYENK